MLKLHLLKCLVVLTLRHACVDQCLQSSLECIQLRPLLCDARLRQRSDSTGLLHLDIGLGSLDLSPSLHHLRLVAPCRWWLLGWWFWCHDGFRPFLDERGGEGC